MGRSDIKGATKPWIAALMTGLAVLLGPGLAPVHAAGLAPTVAAKPVVKPVTVATSPRPVVAKLRSALPPTVTDRVFAHLKSDLPVDPAAHLGRLPNGMTYIIYPNKTPPGAVSMRLRVEAGSINEKPGEHGVAHFLEHMAFQGSAHIAEGELVHMLERHGLRFGADTNAFTTETSTGYQLDLPNADADSLKVAMLIMGDTAQSLTIAPEAAESEREIVLSEMRSRDTPESHAYKARLKSILTGQTFSDHEVIGTKESLKAINYAQIRRFYKTWYRPERTTLIVAGDIDPVVIEAMIKATFSGWKAQTPPPLPVKYGTYKPKGFSLGSYIEPGLGTAMTMSWFKPYDESLSTRASYKRILLDSLATDMIGRRLASINTQDVPYLSIAFSREGYLHSADGLTISFSPKPGRVANAVTRAYEAVRQFATYGDSDIYKSDFDDAIAAYNLGFKNEAAAQPTRDSSAIADSLFSDVDDNNALMSPSQTLALWKSLRAEITPKDIKARLAQWIGKDQPFIFYFSENPLEIDLDNLTQHWELANLMPVAEPSPLVKTEWPFTDFGTPSPLVSQKDETALGFTQLTYGNGLVVNVKPTAFKSDQVLIRARFEGGTDRLSKTDTVPAILAAFFSENGVLRGGLGDLSSIEVGDALVGKNYGLRFDLDEAYTDVDGATSNEDLLTEVQLMTAFITRPQFNKFSVKSMLNEYANQYRSIVTSPESFVGYVWPQTLFPNDSRYALPDPQSLGDVNEDSFARFMKDALKPRRMEISFVGDVTVEQVKAVVAKTFASLPAAPPEAITVSRPVQTEQKSFSLIHQGAPDQAAALVLWPTEGFYHDLRRSRGLKLLSEVINLRLTSILREKEGLAYSPEAYWSASAIYDVGSMLTAAGINPAQEERFFKTLNQITDELKSSPISADELLRARKPLLEKRLADEKDNGFWINIISASDFEPKIPEAVSQFRTYMMSYDPQELQVLAQSYLAADKAITLVVRPAGGHEHGSGLPPVATLPSGSETKTTTSVKSGMGPGAVLQLPSAFKHKDDHTIH